MKKIWDLSKLEHELKMINRFHSSVMWDDMDGARALDKAMTVSEQDKLYLTLQKKHLSLTIKDIKLLIEKIEKEAA